MSSVKGKENTNFYEQKTKLNEFYSNWRNLSSFLIPTRSLATDNTYRNYTKGNLTLQNAWEKSSSCSAILTLWLPLNLPWILKDVSTERERERKKANISTIPLYIITEYPFKAIKNYQVPSCLPLLVLPRDKVPKNNNFSWMSEHSHVRVFTDLYQC